MESTYRVSHTAYPDGSIVKHIAGMHKPQAENIGTILKHSLMKAAKRAKKMHGSHQYDERILNTYAIH